MRPIKFRAKRIDNGKWVYGHYFKTPLTDENSGTTPDKGWFFLTGEPRHCISSDGVVFVIDPETIGEFTGLHDKNGKEIWEGDIVGGWEGCRLNLTVFWDVIHAQFRVRAVENIWWFFHTDLTKQIEVLGNIYENPELLK